jgi:Tat protein secretion system quality control protein TatD with DNase activity
MAETMDVVAKAFSRFLTGFSLSKAMLEDYAKVVAKLENVPEQEVIDRIKKRSDEIFEEVKAKQLEETQAAENL